MTTIKTITIAALLAAASTGAFASEVDGARDNAWLAQTPISQSVASVAPAPTASAVAKHGINLDATGQIGTLNDAVTP